MKPLRAFVRVPSVRSFGSGAYVPRKVCIAAAQAVVSRGGKLQQEEARPESRNLTQRILQDVVQRALDESGLHLSDLDGVVCVPSLADPHFMEAHHQATHLGLFGASGKPVWCRTIDTGGAGPISAINTASTFIQSSKAEVIAVIAVDAVGSLDAETFSKRADQSCQNHTSPLPSPVIPHGYARVTDYQLTKYGGTLTRDHLRLVPVLESIHAAMQPEALTKRPLSLEEVRNSRDVAPNVSLLECARRADGGACIILASNHFLRSRRSVSDILANKHQIHPVILGTGEASGPLFPPENIERETYFSCEMAMRQAYEDAQLCVKDIDFFGLYDCFPICLVRALEACGLAEKGGAGLYLERVYEEYQRTGSLDSFPVNTHGGLLCFGAPWEVPAAFNVVEAVRQLKGEAQGRQIEKCKRALVYGNGGIFSSSAVCIIGRGRYDDV